MTFKKQLKIVKEKGAPSIASLAKTADMETFKDKLKAEGSLIKWERTDWDKDNTLTIDIECDSAGTYQRIADYSMSLGNWHPQHQVYEA